MQRPLAILLLLFISFKLLAKHDLGGGISISDQQLQQLRNSLGQLGTAKEFYHWTSFETASRWIIQGHLDWGEVDFYNRETGNRQVHGAGIYSAGNQTSSRSFGDTLVAFRVPGDVLVYDANTVRSILGRSLNNFQMTNLGKLLPFIRLVDNYSQWYITHHPRVVSNIRFPEHLERGVNPINAGNAVRLIDRLQKALPHHDHARYLESLIRLSYYMDGIAYYRALKVNPRNPWSEFEPHNFEKYRRAREHFENLALTGNDPHLAKLSRGGVIGQGISQNDWVKIQIEDVLADMYRRVAGVSGDINQHIRVEGIRAGGSLEGNTFQATNVELAELKSNKFLQVEHRPHPSGQGHLVAYHYPDSFHFQHLDGLISSDLMNELNRTNKEDLWNDSGLRHHLNRRIIRELLENVFRSHHNRSLPAQGRYDAQILKDLISIHPFKDFNGRTTRLYFDTLYLASGKTPAYNFLSDFDLVRPINEYNQILTEGTQAHEILVKAMLKEFLIAESENRPARYRDLPELNELFKALKPIGVDVSQYNFNRMGQREYELIRQRRFVELFDRLSR